MSRRLQADGSQARAESFWLEGKLSGARREAELADDAAAGRAG